MSAQNAEVLPNKLANDPSLKSQCRLQGPWIGKGRIRSRAALHFRRIFECSQVLRG